MQSDVVCSVAVQLLHGTLRGSPTDGTFTYSLHRLVAHVCTLQGKVRLDAYLAAQLPDASRAKISASIKAGLITINRAVVSKPSYTVKPGDSIIAALLPPEPCTVRSLQGGNSQQWAACSEEAEGGAAQQHVWVLVVEHLSSSGAQGLSGCPLRVPAGSHS